MISLSRWKKIHKFQEKPGWCGPAVIQMALQAAGIKQKQSVIAKAVNKPWWGTNQQIMLAYLSKFFKVVNYKHNAKAADISKHLKLGHVVILDWWDKLDEESPEGHYSIAG